MLVNVHRRTEAACSATTKNFRTARSKGIVNDRRKKATTESFKVNCIYGQFFLSEYFELFLMQIKCIELILPAAVANTEIGLAPFECMHCSVRVHEFDLNN